MTVTLKSPEGITEDRAVAAPEPARDVSSSPSIPEDSKMPLTVTSESPNTTEGQGNIGSDAARISLSLSITEGAERPVVAKLETSTENAGDGPAMGKSRVSTGACVRSGKCGS